MQLGKREVGITGLEPVGNYAVQPTFSDGHNSGLYTWAYLYKLGAEKDKLWQAYLDQLAAAGYPGRQRPRRQGRHDGQAVFRRHVHGPSCGHKH